MKKICKLTNDKYIPYNFVTSYEMLKDLYKKPFKKSKKLYVFAGPNGSGKSTLIANLIKNQNFSTTYINADIIGNEIFGNIKDEKERNEKSMFYTMDIVKENILKGNSLCYETVLSHSSKLDIVKLAIECGYKIISYIVYTDNPEINIERVKLRARQGGHDVPEDKVRTRYYRAMENIELLKLLSDEIYEFNNSQNKY